MYFEHLKAKVGVKHSVTNTLTSTPPLKRLTVGLMAKAVAVGQVFFSTACQRMLLLRFQFNCYTNLTLDFA
jgi:hypothetical protein